MCMCLPNASQKKCGSIFFLFCRFETSLLSVVVFVRPNPLMFIPQEAYHRRETKQMGSEFDEGESGWMFTTNKSGDE